MSSSRTYNSRKRRSSSYSRSSKRRRFNPYSSRTFGYPLNSTLYRSGFFALKAIEVVSTDNLGTIFREFYTHNPTGYNDVNSVGQLFDQYKPTMIKFQWFPKLPNDTSAQTGYKPIHTFLDYDNAIGDLTSTGITEPTAIGYANHKAFNLHQPWSRYVRLPTIQGGSSTTNSVTYGQGYFDFALPPTRGLFYLYATGIDTNTEYGTLVTTLYLKTMNQR